MEFNKKDENIYTEFLNQMDTFDDNKFNIYSNYINDFIKEKYNSNDSRLYDLDDFIQEAYALLYSDITPVVGIKRELNKLYNNMNHKEVKKEKPIQIDFRKYFETIENPLEKRILKALILDIDLKEIAQELNITISEMKTLVKKILNDLKKCIKENKVTYIENKKEGKIR